MVQSVGRGWRDGSVCKVHTMRALRLTFGSQHSYIRVGMAACNPSTREKDQRIPGARWQASVTEFVSPKFSERPCLQKLRCEVREKDT